jgi:hypothetical protein
VSSGTVLVKWPGATVYAKRPIKAPKAKLMGDHEKCPSLNTGGRRPWNSESRKECAKTHLQKQLVPKM